MSAEGPVGGRPPDPNVCDWTEGDGNADVSVENGSVCPASLAAFPIDSER
jgi:hypothetical protein